jgi:transglutaminase-like putative cysteine protease
MKLVISATLPYALEKPVDSVFLLHAAMAPSQLISRESFQISGGPPISCFDMMAGNRAARVHLPAGNSIVSYDAEVEVNSRAFEPQSVDEFPFEDLPPDVLVYLLPSRFCPSDLFTELAAQTFGGLARGYTRAAGIADWVHATLAYEAGSTGPHASAADAFQQGKGVCRDFAHVAISVLRAAGIPARYASVYADALSPPDFHAVVEVYLHGPEGAAWFTLDPTYMSSADAAARIAVGRDAADVPFAWTLDNCDSTKPDVRVSAPGRANTARSTLAVVGV